MRVAPRRWRQELFGPGGRRRTHAATRGFGRFRAGHARAAADEVRGLHRLSIRPGSPNPSACGAADAGGRATDVRGSTSGPGVPGEGDVGTTTGLFVSVNRFRRRHPFVGSQQARSIWHLRPIRWRWPIWAAPP